MEIKKFESFDSKVPEGWVNVKLDDQLFKRMNRYVVTLDGIVGETNKYDLFKKIEAISFDKINQYISNDTISVQSKISIITILQYLKELRTHFDPTSSGFLLEGFLATLIHGRIEPGRKPFDMTTTYNELDAVRFKATGGIGKTYQIKLYKIDSYIKVNMSQICDYYVVCLKENNDIWVHILDGRDPRHEQFIGGPLSAQYIKGKFPKKEEIPNVESYIRHDGNKEYMVINTKKLRENKLGIKLEIGNLDELIKRCGENIVSSINDTYVKLSELHYNIDSLVSGVDKNQRLINVDEAKSRAEQTIREITESITRLSENIK
jgi:hypothetical protein